MFKWIKHQHCQSLLSFLLLSMTTLTAQADMIVNYMKIANSLPQMAVKADPKAQAWARSARNIITMTDESIAQTLLAMNAFAAQQGRPLFCMPKNAKLDAASLDAIIQNTYRSSQLSSYKKQSMTVSEVALYGVLQQFPCNAMGNQQPTARSSIDHGPAQNYAMAQQQIAMQSVSRDP